MISLAFTLDPLPSQVRRLYIAYSAGLDSAVLLHCLLPFKGRYELVLWHINHGLQENAQQMESFAEQQAHKYQVEFRVDHLDLDPEQGNLEARAREQRYKVFADVLGTDDALLTAHHMNDQAETLLQNLMRGSGAIGLSAIAEQRPLGQGLLFRPLLNSKRSTMESFANQHRLQWVEDPSNTSMRFDRNYLRHQVIPLLLERWPAAIQQMHRVCDWQNETAQLLHEFAEEDYSRCAVQRAGSRYTCLSVSALKVLSDARKKNLLRYWLRIQGKKVLGYKKIEDLLIQLQAKADAMPVINGEAMTIRLYQGCLYIVDPLPEQPVESIELVKAASPVEIPGSSVHPSRQQVLDQLQLEDKQQTIELKFRQQVSDSSNHNSAHKRKRLFQKYQVPPWLRSFTPQIWIDGRLVDLWLL